MDTLPIDIVSFQPDHQPGIDAMLAGISVEFPENIFSPAYKKIADVYKLPGRHYWVALAGEVVVGTIGVIIIDNYAVLKAMFVDRAYRGGDARIASRLLQKVLEEAMGACSGHLYLGTMGQFKAAQRFYEKNGFARIAENVLLDGYPGNRMDTEFYQLKLVQFV